MGLTFFSHGVVFKKNINVNILKICFKLNFDILKHNSKWRFFLLRKEIMFQS